MAEDPGKPQAPRSNYASTGQSHDVRNQNIECSSTNGHNYQTPTVEEDHEPKDAATGNPQTVDGSVTTSRGNNNKDGDSADENGRTNDASSTEPGDKADENCRTNDANSTEPGDSGNEDCDMVDAPYENPDMNTGTSAQGTHGAFGKQGKVSQGRKRRGGKHAWASQQRKSSKWMVNHGSKGGEIVARKEKGRARIFRHGGTTVNLPTDRTLRPRNPKTGKVETNTSPGISKTDASNSKSSLKMAKNGGAKKSKNPTIRNTVPEKINEGPKPGEPKPGDAQPSIAQSNSNYHENAEPNTQPPNFNYGNSASSGKYRGFNPMAADGDEPPARTSNFTSTDWSRDIENQNNSSVSSTNQRSSTEGGHYKPPTVDDEERNAETTDVEMEDFHVSVTTASGNNNDNGEMNQAHSGRAGDINDEHGQMNDADSTRPISSGNEDCDMVDASIQEANNPRGSDKQDKVSPCKLRSGGKRARTSQKRSSTKTGAQKRSSTKTGAQGSKVMDNTGREKTVREKTVRERTARSRVSKMKGNSVARRTLRPRNPNTGKSRSRVEDKTLARDCE
ncbi:hypothetical protein M433DRAFT_8150 [Acidomyces richmondensis BFW]|nr:hypothetical protein M433DRAFT_8150 [Acidomyces richmondensis BFW]